MYAVKPWGKAYLVGNTIGTFALGIGMRWRESEVEVVERRADPYDEVNNMRRCVLPLSTLTLLQDLGVTRSVATRHLAPAQRWRFVSAAALEVLREGDTYSGCSPLEPVFQVREGQLMRTLRTEFMRFGGALTWATEAHDAFEPADGCGTWTLRKQFGPGANAQAIVGFCRGNAALNKMLIADDPERLAVLFDQRTGVCRAPSKELQGLFGKDCDVVIAVGRGVGMHLWRVPAPSVPPTMLPTGGSNEVIAWRLTSKGRSDAQQLVEGLHPVLGALLETSDGVQLKPLVIPATTPAIREDAAQHRVSVMGEALLPVDPFEWRGDRARAAIEEAATLCRLLYGKKYHRGHAPTLLRQMEQDCITRRAAMVRRDLVDAEYFLAVHPQLPRDDDDGEPQLKRAVTA